MGETAGRPTAGQEATRRRGRSGVVWVGLGAAALGSILVMMAILAVLIVVNSTLALWPASLEKVELKDGPAFLGVALQRDVAPDGRPRSQFKVANRDLNGGADFRWVYDDAIAARSFPRDAVVVERLENGLFYGFLKDDGQGAQMAFTARLGDFKKRWAVEVEPVREKLGALGDAWQAAHFAGLKANYEARRAAPDQKAHWEAEAAAARDNEAAVKRESEAELAVLNRAKGALVTEQAQFVTADGKDVAMGLDAVVDATWPNRMGVFDKLLRLVTNVWRLLSQYPREANTEGGLFPALFGTAIMVFIMAILAFPLGVAAGVYLREYAKDGFLSRAARVAVNNLAGVPSIVYGIFGLGFFVYGMGGTIDQLLYPERVEAGITTFGGGGLLWSSLTLGLLTLPVVVVATEEALTTIPSEIRQGSLALGATRFQTLWRVVLPMASPGIMTGFILAMARAAGEVAPLMLTGVVKSAHSLPLDTAWPFLHLDRKFMHLGFHIYDMGFQSPNVEAAKPMVYVTALVLLVLVFVLNLAAISLRRRMRDKYALRGF